MAKHRQKFYSEEQEHYKEAARHAQGIKDSEYVSLEDYEDYRDYHLEAARAARRYNV